MTLDTNETIVIVLRITENVFEQAIITQNALMTEMHVNIRCACANAEKMTLIEDGMLFIVFGTFGKIYVEEISYLDAVITKEHAFAEP